MRQLIFTFNSYTFQNTAQTLISYLTVPELQALIAAIEKHPHLKNIKQIAIAKLYISQLNKFDRTLYYNVYENIEQYSYMEKQRKLLSNGQTYQLQTLLNQYKRILSKGAQLFGDSFQIIKQSLETPCMALPPIKRTTVAPQCKTTYQIVLACKKLDLLGDNDYQFTLCISEQEVKEYLQQFLLVYVAMNNLYMSSVEDQFQFFAQITLRFLVYKDIVLSLFQLFPFIKPQTLINLWSINMEQHYLRANQTCVSMLGINQQFQSQYGFLSAEEIISQGYLNDYIQGLVDMSVDEEMVAFCGHSKQKLNFQYSLLESTIVDQLHVQYFQDCSIAQISNQLSCLLQKGIKTSTIRQICQHLSCHDISVQQSKSSYLAMDTYIENCGSINGLIIQRNCDGSF